MARGCRRRGGAGPPRTGPPERRARPQNEGDGQGPRPMAVSWTHPTHPGDSRRMGRAFVLRLRSSGTRRWVGVGLLGWVGVAVVASCNAAPAHPPSIDMLPDGGLV